MFEFVFNGTGTSSSLPSINCLTDPKTTCRTCPTTLRPEGKKNIRRNTSAILRKKIPRKTTSASTDNTPVDDTTGSPRDEEGDREVVIVIDVGKTFLAAALEWFPKYGFRKIDAVLLTHAHADATNGLDDLRGWTLSGTIQETIDIYLSVACFQEIQRAFPYLVSKGFATGGGDVPAFSWHIIEEGESFNIGGEGGFWITPVEVDHGRQFPTAREPMPMPLNNRHFIPTHSGSATPSPLYVEAAGVSGTSTPASHQEVQNIPFKCFAFIINHELIYMSDVSHIPDSAWPILEKQIPPPWLPPKGTDAKHEYKVLIVDVLRPAPFSSHFGFGQAVDAARRIGARRNLMLGMEHKYPHDDWVEIGQRVGPTPPKEPPNEIIEEVLEVVSEGPPIWIRPAFDGLRLVIPEADDKTDLKLVDGYEE